MSIRQSVFKYCVTAFMISPLFTYADSASDFMAYLNTIESLSGYFEQSIRNSEGDEIADPTEGEFHLKRPGKFYWKTSPPFEQLVIGNERGLILYDPDLEQVTIYDKEAFLNSPAAVLSGSSEQIQTKYSIDGYKDNKKETFVLKEIDLQNQSFDSLSFVFEKNTLKGLSLVDQMDQVTTIKFKKVKTNQAIDADLFIFVPPEEADIIIQ